MFILPDSDSYTDSDNMLKGYTGTETYGDSNAKSQWKLVNTNISVKLGTVAIGIGIVASVGPVETLLNIIIEPSLLCLGTGIGVEQCKHTIVVYNKFTFTERFCVIEYCKPQL